MSVSNPNFSCSDPNLSRDNITGGIWINESDDPSYIRAITSIAIVQLLFVVVGLPWNFVVAAVIVVKKLFKEPSYIFLLSLVISDMLVCGIVFPFNVASGLRRAFTIGSSDYTRCQACHATLILILFLIFVSIFSLALMSTDRLIYIKNSFSYRRYIKPWRALVAVIFTWIFCLLIALPPVFGFGEIRFTSSLGACGLIILGETHVTLNIYYIVFLSIIITVPFILTVVVNIWLLVIACKSVANTHKRVRSHNNIRHTTNIDRMVSEQKINIKYHKKQINLAKIFGIIFLVNTIIWMSTCLISVFSIAITGHFPDVITLIVYFAFLIQPVVHPMLETCLVGKAKSVMIKCLCFWCKKNEQQDAFHSTTSSTSVLQKV